MPIRLKCDRCENFTNAPSIRSGDSCPMCSEGTLYPAEPLVFESTWEFRRRMRARFYDYALWDRPPFDPRVMKAREN